MIEPLLLTTTRVTAFDGKRPLTGASGFFFEREGRLFLVTGRHVLIDKPGKHFPNRIELELHVDGKNLARSTNLSVRLYLVAHGVCLTFQKSCRATRRGQRIYVGGVKSEKRGERFVRDVVDCQILVENHWHVLHMIVETDHIRDSGKVPCINRNTQICNSSAHADAGH